MKKSDFLFVYKNRFLKIQEIKKIKILKNRLVEFRVKMDKKWREKVD